MPGAKFLLALLAASCATQSFAGSQPGPLPNWGTAASVPESVPQQMNILRLDGDRLLWNGRETSETDIRAFLRFIENEMSPQPLVVLSYSARTPSERVQRARLLVDEVIRCEPAECLEVTGASA